MTSKIPQISAVVCTRNRGDRVVETIETILGNMHPAFEVILVDQSTNQDTEQAIEHLRADSRLHYIPTSTRGVARGRNLGLSQAQGGIVAFTDDDCRVPNNWLEVILRIFQRYEHVGMVFCNVDPAPHDSSAGFIPSYQRTDSMLVRTMWQKCCARGIGAGMAVRRTAFQEVWGFDQSLGPGTRFSACEDGDLAVRMLIHHWWLYETHEVSVVHYGFRTWYEGKMLTKRNWFGIGAAYVKSLKCGHWSIAIVIMYEALVMGLWLPLSAIFKLKKPQGLKRFYYLCLGFIKGIQASVDCDHIMYQLDEGSL